MDMSLHKLWEMEKDREAWHAAVHVIAKNWTWLSDWIELNWVLFYLLKEMEKPKVLKKQMLPLVLKE